MIFKSYLLGAVCTCIVFVSLSANAAFTYDIAEFTQNNGTNTFNDQFLDGIEPPSGSVSDSDYAIRPWTLSTTFGPDRESGGLLELNSDDAEIGKDGDNMIGAFLINQDYFFSPNAGGSVTGAFQINNGFFSNTVFGIDIDNFESGLLTPIILEDAVAGIYSDSSGNINAVWGDNSAINQLDITADVIGVNQFTLSLEIDVLNQVSACFDYRSDGSCDLVIDNFKTMTFTPSNPNDLFSGGFIAIDNFSIVPETTTVTLADYLVTPNPGDSWTYRTNMDSTIYLSGGDVFFPAGTEFTVTEPWYVNYTLLPGVADTGQAILVEPPNISIYLDIIPELTVPAGTFNNILRMTWLDSNYPANLINTSLGINPLVDEGVTDVSWFALGIGEIKGLGVDAASGSLDADWDLISYSVNYIAPGWVATDFHTLCTTPTECTPTRAIEFDSQNNLYIENTLDDNSGIIEILKLDASSGYTTSSIFASYGTAYKGVTGLDFDSLGKLYVSERSVDGDAGIVRSIDVPLQVLQGDIMAFANHRPTGVDADSAGNVYYSGRKESDGLWGKLFQIDSSLVRTELSANTVATGIAVDAYGNIFISTPQRTDLPLLSNSIYMFRSTDTALSEPILIGTFIQRGGELTFDDIGNLYMVADDQVSIIKLSPADTDSDGVWDYMDNCTLIPNPTQCDGDLDGYGNHCDADFNNDLIVNGLDIGLFKAGFGTTDVVTDLNCDGITNGLDIGLLKVLFGSPPGPSGLNP